MAPPHAGAPVAVRSNNYILADDVQLVTHPDRLPLRFSRRQEILRSNFHGRTTVSVTEVSVLQARTYGKTCTSRVSSIN